MLASNGQVAYLGYDPKSDGSGVFFSALFSSFLGFYLYLLLCRCIVVPVPRSSYFLSARLEVGVVINAQRAAAAAASDLDSDLSSNWWL